MILYVGIDNKPQSAKQDYNHFQFVLLADQITLIGNEKSLKIKIVKCLVSNYPNLNNFYP